MGLSPQEERERDVLITALGWAYDAVLEVYDVTPGDRHDVCRATKERLLEMQRAVQLTGHPGPRL